MKKTFLLFSVFLGFLFCVRADDTSAIGKESVSFDGQVLLLASQGSTETGSLKEYLPAGQKFESWTKLAAVHRFTKLSDPVEAAAGLERTVKQANPQAQSSVTQNSATGECMIDFITWPTDNPDPAFVEFNIFKYKKAADGGLISFQYALRAYGDDGIAFLKQLKTERPRLIRLMAGYVF